jgi:uncharacterized protein (TIGR00251 family)
VALGAGGQQVGGVADLYEITEDAVVLRVHAQPGAGRSAVTGRHGDAVKVKVAAAPEGGRANAALVALLAETFGVQPSTVTLVSGPASRTKRFRLEGADPESVAATLRRLVSRADAGSGKAHPDRHRPR